MQTDKQRPARWCTVALGGIIMDENMELQQRMAPGRKVVLLAVAGLTALIVLIYLGLCIYVGASRTILPNVYAVDLALGGKTQEQAQQAVENWLNDRYADVTYTLTCGESTAVITGAAADVDGALVAQNAYMVGRTEPFLKRGAVILSHLMQGWGAVECPVTLNAEGEGQFAQALKQLSEAENVPLVETVWSVEGDSLKIVRGITGVSVDEAGMRTAVLEAMQQPGSRQVAVPTVQISPAPLDLAQVRMRMFSGTNRGKCRLCPMWSVSILMRHRHRSSLIVWRKGNADALS